MNTKLYTVKEVAHIADRSEQTIRRWIEEGKLPAEKFPKTKQGRWYIQREDIPTFLRESYEKTN